MKFDGATVAIRGATFGSMGDIASKGTGGGLISMNCEGPTKFLAPGSLDVKVCGPGKHNESIQKPEVPKSEWHPNKRVEVMKSLAKSAEDLFEVAAAEHNIADGSITHGSELSRRTTPEERAAGGKEGDQMIWAVCKTCGYRREIDQATDRNNTVEAKSSSAALGASGQKANNRALVARGKAVTYKGPPSAGSSSRR